MKPNTEATDAAVADPDDDALSESVLSRREVRISLGVIGALLIVLGVLVARRWSGEEDPVAKAADDKAKPAAEGGAPATAAATPAKTEELPPIALRPVDGAEPPAEEPLMPAPASSDPFQQQASASVTEDTAHEIGQATLTPDATATDDGFPSADETGIAATPPLGDALPEAEPSAGEMTPDSVASSPEFEAPAAATPFEINAPATDAAPEAAASEAASSEAASSEAASSEAASSEANVAHNPLRAAASPSVEPPLGDEAELVAPVEAPSSGFGSAPPAPPSAFTEEPIPEPPSFDTSAEAHPPANGLVDNDTTPFADHHAEPPSAPTTTPAGVYPSVASPPLDQPPTAATAESYRAVAGDTFWSISKRAYGTGAYYQALAEFNRGIVPSGQAPAAGQSLLIPTAHELEQRYPQLCPTVASIRRPAKAPPTSGMPQAADASQQIPSAQVLPRGQRTYRVKSGETLYDIAQQQLGSPLRWTDIYKLNRQQLGDRPHDLRAGMDLILPTTDDRSAANPRIRP